ncbi:MAG TPA: hypothetical protein VF277_08885, partial [Steroidobacteraceae bacterium]
SAPVAASPAAPADEPAAPKGVAAPAASLEQRQERGSERTEDARGPQKKSAVPAPPPDSTPPAMSRPATVQRPQLEQADTTGAMDAAPAAPAPVDAAPSAQARENGVTGSVGALGAASLAAHSTAVATSVQHIVDLHARGDLQAAADALRKLRAQTDHADEQLPDALRDWARTVR